MEHDNKVDAANTTEDVVEQKGSMDVNAELDKAFEKHTKSLKDILGINVPHTLTIIDKLIGELKVTVEDICDRLQ